MARPPRVGPVTSEEREHQPGIGATTSNVSGRGAAGGSQAVVTTAQGSRDSCGKTVISTCDLHPAGTLDE